MPLELKIKHDNNTTILVWHLQEAYQTYADKLNLTQRVLDEINTFSPKRRLEWLSARYLFKLILNDFRIEDLYKDEYGKPFIKGSKQYISISHSHEYASIIISDKVVGIDIQKIHDNIEKIAHKFISPEEKLFVDNENKMQNMHIIWGAKESMYKGYGKKELGFIKHMKVQPYNLRSNTTLFRGSVTKGDIKEDYKLYTRSFKNYVLVYTLKN